MNNYTVRVSMTIEAEIEVEANSRDEAQANALLDYDEVWGQSSVIGTSAYVIEENGKDV